MLFAITAGASEFTIKTLTIEDDGQLLDAGSIVEVYRARLRSRACS